MKKLLIAALAALSAFGVSAATTTELWTLQSRTNWVITGCGSQNQTNVGGDGVYQHMMDDNVNSFYHSNWSSDAVACTTTPHYFVIDRGANETSPIGGFGYLPRQNSTQGNGYITEYRVYVLDNIDGLNTVAQATSANKADHNIATFVSDKTADLDSSFDIAYNNAATHTEHRVKFDEPLEGRYFLFVVDNSSGSSGNKYVNVAEFYLYDVTTTTELETVTLKFPSVAGFEYTQTLSNIPSGTPLSDYLTDFGGGFFTYTGDSDAKITAEGDYNVPGTWNFPIQFNKAYRLTVKPQGTHNNNENTDNLEARYYASESQIYLSTKKFPEGYTNGEFEPERLWYFKGVGIDANGVKVTLHNLSENDANGLQVATANHSIASITNSPSSFYVHTTTNSDAQNGDFALCHADNLNCYLNDWGNIGVLSVYAGGGAQSVYRNDNGAIIRPALLQTSEFSELDTWNYDGRTLEFEADKKNAAITDLSIANLRALFTIPQALKDLHNAIAALDNHNIGTCTGQYNNADKTLADKLASAQAVFANQSATNAQMTEAASSIAASTWTINQPVNGKFYRLKRPGTTGDNSVYASCVADANSKLPMITHNGAASVWVYKDGVLVSWVDGQIIGNFASGGNWGTGASGATNVSSGVTFSEGSAPGTYYIEPTSGRHMHNANATVDCCGTAETNGNDDWEIEEVQTNNTWIPIALPTDVAAGYKFTLVSPLALNNYDGRLKFWTLNLVEGKVRKTEASSIPANTPVLCEYVKGYETAKGSVFLPAGNTAEVESNLEWSYFAKTQKADVEATETSPAQTATHFMVWDGENFSRVADNGIIPGFAPYYEAADATESATPVEVSLPLAGPVAVPTIEAVEVEGTTTGYEFHIKGVSLHSAANAHSQKLYITKNQRGNGAHVAQRRAATVQPINSDNEYELSHSDFETNSEGNGVYATLGTKLEKGTYYISTDDEGFFAVEEGKVMPMLSNVAVEVNGNGTTEIMEVISGAARGEIYDLQGRRLAAPQKGINIIGGRKVLVK